MPPVSIFIKYPLRIFVNPVLLSGVVTMFRIQKSEVRIQDKTCCRSIPILNMDSERTTKINLYLAWKIPRTLVRGASILAPEFWIPIGLVRPSSAVPDTHGLF